MLTNNRIWALVMAAMVAVASVPAGAPAQVYAVESSAEESAREAGEADTNTEEKNEPETEEGISEAGDTESTLIEVDEVADAETTGSTETDAVVDDVDATAGSTEAADTAVEPVEEVDADVEVAETAGSTDAATGSTGEEENAAAHVNGTITIEGEDSNALNIEGDGHSADELFAAYVEQAFGISKKPVKLKAARRAARRLDGLNCAMYSLLASYVNSIADGERESTEFEITVESLESDSVQLSWTAEELGVTSLGTVDENGEATLSDEAFEAARERSGYDLNLIVGSLMADFPYQMYWYDKTQPISWGGFDLTAEYDENGINRIGASGAVTICFPVASDYAAGEYAVDLTIGRSVRDAVQNAEAIIEEFSGESDYQKLRGYFSKICDFVSYNQEAADGNADYGDPWQLIWVFDGDPSTNVVCEGYAKAFQYLCDKTAFDGDISCISVSGNMESESDAGPHMWNIVRMENGLNYLVDLTNCDGYNIGAPDKLFLVGVLDEYSGSVSAGYILTLDRGTISYSYDDLTLSLYDDSELQLAFGNYKDTIGYPEAYEKTVNGIKYRIEQGRATVIGYTGTPVNVVLPESVDNYPVIEIGSMAFDKCKSLKSIKIPRTVEVIADCEENFDGAFYGCKKLTSVEFADDSSLRVLGRRSFEKCTALSRINLPGSLREINESALDGCQSITDLVLPEGLELIGQNALSNLGITTLHIPSTTTMLSWYFAYDCANLEHITVAEGNEKLKVVDDVLYYFSQWYTMQAGVDDSLTDNGECWGLFLYPLQKKDTSYTLWKEAGGIGDGSEIGRNKYIKKINLCNAEFNANEIRCEFTVGSDNPYHTMSGGLLLSKDGKQLVKAPMTKTGELVVPGSVVTVLEGSLSHTKYSTIRFSEGVKKIENYTFSESAVKKVVFAKSVQSIGFGAFYKCDQLAEVYVLNPKCVIDEEIIGMTTLSNPVFYGYTGSKTRDYTNATGRPFRSINKLYISNTSKNIRFGDSFTLKLYYGPDAPAATWKSSNPKVASVKNGVVKGLGLGTSTITARCADGKMISCKVTVVKRVFLPNVILSKTAFTYNGKAQKPTVVVKEGTKVIAARNYKVTYSKGLKNVGAYKVTVELQGNYSGVKTVTYKIVPKGTAVSKIAAGRKSFRVRWRKQTVQTTGYQVSYSQDKTFKKGVKTKTVKGASQTLAEVSGLAGGKYYYVRVRTYKKIGKVSYFSGWSKAVAVKVKP